MVSGGVGCAGGVTRSVVGRAKNKTQTVEARVIRLK